jgi:hypothetical protein
VARAFLPAMVLAMKWRDWFWFVIAVLAFLPLVSLSRGIREVWRICSGKRRK